MSRDKLLLRADFFIFSRRVNAGEVGSRSRVLACFPCTGATTRGGPTHLWRGPPHGRDEGSAAWRCCSAPEPCWRAPVPSDSSGRLSVSGAPVRGRLGGGAAPANRVRAHAVYVDARAGVHARARARGAGADTRLGGPRRRHVGHPAGSRPAQPLPRPVRRQAHPRCSRRPLGSGPERQPLGA